MLFTFQKRVLCVWKRSLGKKTISYVKKWTQIWLTLKAMGGFSSISKSNGANFCYLNAKLCSKMYLFLPTSWSLNRTQYKMKLLSINIPHRRNSNFQGKGYMELSACTVLNFYFGPKVKVMTQNGGPRSSRSHFSILGLKKWENSNAEKI